MFPSIWPTGYRRAASLPAFPAVRPSSRLFRKRILSCRRPANLVRRPRGRRVPVVRWAWARIPQLKPLHGIVSAILSAPQQLAGDAEPIFMWSWPVFFTRAQVRTGAEASHATVKVLHVSIRRCQTAKQPPRPSSPSPQSVPEVTVLSPSIPSPFQLTLALQCWATAFLRFPTRTPFPCTLRLDTSSYDSGLLGLPPKGGEGESVPLGPRQKASRAWRNLLSWESQSHTNSPRALSQGASFLGSYWSHHRTCGSSGDGSLWSSLAAGVASTRPWPVLDHQRSARPLWPPGVAAPTRSLPQNTVHSILQTPRTDYLWLGHG